MLLLTLRETYTLNRLSSFQNPRRKGGKFDHRPERPEVLLRHWPEVAETGGEHYRFTTMQRGDICFVS